MTRTISSPGGPAVLLVSMPWTVLGAPSLGLGILRSVLDRAGVPCKVRHLCLFMLERLRANTYEDLSDAYGLNDFLFGGVIEQEVTDAQVRALRDKVLELLSRGKFEQLRGGGSDGVIETLLRLRSEVIPDCVGRWAQEISEGPWTLVGFTCMFDQTIASAALAKKISELAPEKMLALGGYAVRSPTAEMLLQAFPWIDGICGGEGEPTIVNLAEASAGRKSLHEVPGLHFRSVDGAIVETPPAPLVDLDETPTPNYDDFFEELRELSTTYKISITPPSLPVENSRGCWWGAKHHCTFCGIRDADLAYRHKSPDVVFNTLTELSDRYCVYGIQFADYILPNAYFETLLPRLARADRRYRIFAELKSNISEERFRLLADAGFEQLQPGIESFCGSALREMKKGVSAAQNVFTLVLGRRHGVSILYNLLYGFPGDVLEDYERMARLLPNLIHLDPPVTCLPVQIIRWAPLHTRHREFGYDKPEHEHSYEMIFSKRFLNRSRFDLDDFCYLFERPFENSPALQRVYERIQDFVEHWRAVSKTSWLYGVEHGDRIDIHDKRGEIERLETLDPRATQMLRFCSRIATRERLSQAGFSDAELDHTLADLEAKGLVFADEGRFVSLVPEVRAQGCAHVDTRRAAFAT